MTSDRPGPVPSAGPVPAAPFTELSARRLGPVRRFFVRRPVAADVLVVATYLLLGAGTVVSAAEVDDPLTGPFLWAATLGAGVALLWRRRRPLTTLAVLLGLVVLAAVVIDRFDSLELAVMFALYVVAAARPSRDAWAALGVALVVTVAAVWLTAPPRADNLVVTAPDGTVVEPVSPTLERTVLTTTVALTYLGALAIGMSVRGRRLHVADLLDRANALARDQELRARMARAEERARIAREMHDVVAHSLSVMVTLADGAGAALERSPDRARHALDELSSTGRAALGDMRRILGVLDSPAELDPQPGARELGTLIERFRTAGLPVRVTRTGPDLSDAGLGLTVYRIVQEGLTNTLRHAPGCERVEVAIEVGADRVVVEVVDTGGPGATPSPGSGRGLVGIRERVAAYGGTVGAGPDGAGWRLRAELPREVA